jgi:hypothetical protein
VSDPEERDAVEAPPWRPGLPRAVRVRDWPFQGGPWCRVRLAGTWYRAQVRRRTDRADGRVVYALDVWLDEAVGSPAYRAVYWDAASLRPEQRPEA